MTTVKQNSAETLNYIIVDDETDSDFIKDIAPYLEKAGLTWVLVAQYLTVADTKEAATNGDLADVHIAFVDGNLGRFSSNSHDGRVVNAILSQHAPHVVRVGNSASYEKPDGSEIFLNKDVTEREILQEIDRLARKRLR